MPITLLLFLSALLFFVGLAVVLTKQDVIFVLIGIELMLNAACFNLILLSSHHPQGIQAQAFVLFILAVVACEMAVGLAIVLKVYQKYRTLKINQLRHLQER